MAIYWAGVLFWLCWIVLLAGVDILDTSFHFGRIRQKYRIEQAKLRAKLREFQAPAPDGEPPAENGR